MDIKRLAVLVVGEYRTWPNCAANLFSFFQNRAEQVDYFFVTWSTSSDMPERTITKDDITPSFITCQNNLVSSLVIPQIGRKISTFYNQAYLAKLANVLKREHEIKHQFVYDQVVETRPDIYMRPVQIKWQVMKDYEVCNCGYMGKSSQGFDVIDDVYYRSTSFTNDIIANRYWHRKPADHYVNSHEPIQNWHNHHCMIMEYFTSNGIRFLTSAKDFIGPHIAVRQDAKDVDFSRGNLEELKARYQPSFHSWQIEDSRPVIFH